ncbi:hypothetical protein [Mangrovivirga cuniculi]|uniref:Type II secretion system protein GspC N-terminal domain-containing protein n=1 Tax=Mangrovivirga cuniculi TaxID=2715131 RepID=A0A4D7JMD2_9BACT|nr:hypothetical protein [Mangrovivirga cuniculi]QCK13772.1 hypothetical protein DCC35_02865 [Mangrovivirga cuniculi]
MNKTVKNKFLLVVIVLLWGTIGYFIYDYFQVDDSKVNHKYTNKAIEKKERKIEEEDSLLLSYGDPFGFNIKPKKRVRKVVKPQRQVRRTKPAKSVTSTPLVNTDSIRIYEQLNSIKINGIFANESKNENFANVSVYNKIYILSAGDSILNFRVKGVYLEYLLLQNEESEFTIENNM